MSVTRVREFTTVDNLPVDTEISEGSVVTNYQVYELTNDDGSKQYLKLEVIVDSYGDTQRPGRLLLTQPEEKTVTVWK